MGPKGNVDTMLLFVILVVVIFIAVILVLFLVPFGDENDNSAPTGNLKVGGSWGNYELSVRNLTYDVDAGYVSYALLDRNAIHGEFVVEYNGTPIEGSLLEIYNALLRNPMDGSILHHVSWRDSDGNDRLSDDDVIVLLGVENDRWNGEDVEPGIAEDGMVFRLIYEPTGETICEVVLR